MKDSHHYGHTQLVPSFRDWLAAQSHPQAKASQRVSLPSPEREIRQLADAPRATKKKDEDIETVRQIQAS